MKVEVTRQDVSDSAAMLALMEKWEKFLAVGEGGALSLKVGNLDVAIGISNGAISRLEYGVRNGHGRRVEVLELTIAKLCQQRSQELAKEVCELIRKSMPLPLEPKQ